MKSSTELKRMLDAVDHKSYGAYKSLAGQYEFQGYVLSIDHVQGDPFASPSKLRVVVKQQVARFPAELFDTYQKKTALEDQLIRLFGRNIDQYGGRVSGSGGSGKIRMSRCGQKILERSAMQVFDDRVEARFEVGFPAAGRTILARELEKILFTYLPDIVAHSLIYPNLPGEKLKQAAFLAEDQAYIRRQLTEQGWTAFVADGAVLPRESGVSDRPMKGGVPFAAPDSLAVTLQLPHRGETCGMAIKQGVTLIVGGGYHGKSTLLQALESGVYNHIAGDGREYVITDDTAMKIRAEDGRSIKETDISLFINNLPNKKDTCKFSTENASGSTSQAANVVEAMEAGARCLLIDEDTSATNFMIRDEIMQKLIRAEQEPITPFIDRVRTLYEQAGLSIILVVGSSGTYFDIADTVIQMDCYRAKDITAEARRLGKEYSLHHAAPSWAEPRLARILRKGALGNDRRGVKIKTRGCDTLSLNHEEIDVRYLEQLVDFEQTAALGYIMKYAEERVIDNTKTLPQVVDIILRQVAERGIGAVVTAGYCPDFLALPRRQEIIACFNRFRGLRVEQK